MATFHIESGNETYEIDAPDEATALKAWGQHQGGAQGAPSGAPSGASPTPTPPTPGWSTSRVLNDLGHYPAMGLQAAANGAEGLVNFAGMLGDFANRHTAGLMPKVLTTPVNELPAYFRGEPTSTDTDSTMALPPVNLGELAQPRGAAEAYGSAAVAGTTAALLGGGISRIPAFAQATGKQVAGAIPGLLKEAVTQGAIPGMAVEGAERNLDFSGLSPMMKAAAEYAIGAAAGLASHGTVKAFSKNPIEGVASKLGASENSADAGAVAQKATQEWRDALPAKVEALKDIKPMPVTPEGDVTTDAMFGKVPLDTATVDMSETLKTVNAMSRKGGMVAPLLHEFGNDMPVKVKAILEDIAAKNNPIMEYPPKAVVTPSGPLRADTSPIVEGERGDLVKPPVSKLDRPAAGLLAAPTEVPVAQPGVSPQTNPVQWRMENPGVAGIEPRVTQANPQLPSVVTRNGLPTETVDPGMTGSKQLGEPRAAWSDASTASPPQGLAKMPGEPTYPPEYKNPAGTITGFPLPLRDAMELRSYIGEMTSKGMMPKGSQAAQWDSLYRGLSADLANTMERHGAGAEWNNYNTATTKLYTDGAKFSKFSNDANPGKDDAEPGKVVAGMYNGMIKDPSDIVRVREHMPQVADEIAASLLRTSPEKWSKLSDTAKEALVPNPFDRLDLNLHAAPKPTLLEQETQRGRSERLGAGGYALTEALKSYGFSHEGNSVMQPGMWAALGILAPGFIKSGGELLHNPHMLRVPVTGAIAGRAAGMASDAPDAGASGASTSPLLK